MKKTRDSLPGTIITISGAALLFWCAFATAQFACDYGAHIRIAEKLNFRHPSSIATHSEPLWHICLRGVQAMTHVRPVTAGGIVVGLCYAAMFLMVCRFLMQTVPGITRTGAALASLSVHLCCALWIPPFDPNPYVGQGSPNVWHNPTIIMVKPLSLLFFFIITKEMAKCRENHFRHLIPAGKCLLMAILLILCNLAKPCFAQIFYPAIFLLMIYWLIIYRGGNFRLALELLVTCLPSALLIAAQYVVAFSQNSSSSEKSGIIFAPFVVAGLRTKSIPVSILLAIAFPLFVTIVMLVMKKRSLLRLLAWLMYLCGLLEKLLLAEGGSRLTHGNLAWGHNLALYFIFVVGIRDWLNLRRENRNPAVRIPASVLLLWHLFSGCWYLFYHMLYTGAIN